MRALVVSVIASLIIAAPVAAQTLAIAEGASITFTRESESGITFLSVISTRYTGDARTAFAERSELTIEADATPESVVITERLIGAESLLVAGRVELNGEPMFVVRLLFRDGAFVDEWFATGSEPITDALVTLATEFIGASPSQLADHLPTAADLPGGFIVLATPVR